MAATVLKSGEVSVAPSKQEIGVLSARAAHRILVGHATADIAKLLETRYWNPW